MAYWASLPPTAKHGHLVPQNRGLVDIVRDENDGLGEVLLQPQEFLLQFVPHHGIHGAERLVHQQDGRIGGERPGHADALLLAAGELGGVALSRGAEASPTTSSSSVARLRASALETPLSRGTVAMLSSTERCGISPEDCIT